MISKLKYYFTIAWKKYHFIIPFKELKRFFSNHQKKNYVFSSSSYKKWLHNNYDVTCYTKLSYKPLISIIIPVYNVKGKYLEQCLLSILNQSYDNYEICIVDDASTNKDTIQILKKYKDNPKVKIKHHKKNSHISIASNDAVLMAKGEFITFIDNDDFIDQDALYEIAKVINQNKNIDLIYSDEDKVSANGKFYHTPFFKPDYSPDYLLNVNYICHLLTIRKTVFEKVGGFRKGYEGVQDWDLLLRITEITNHIYHIPRILYHWREIGTSTALNTNNKPYVLEKAIHLIKETLERRNIKGEVKAYDNNFIQIDYQHQHPLVSIIVVINDRFSKYKKNIESIIKNTNYSKLEFILVAKSDEYQKINKWNQYKVKVLKTNKFNESKMINQAAKMASGEYLTIITQKILINDENWLNKLIGVVEKKHIGIVSGNFINNKMIEYGSSIYDSDIIETSVWENNNSSWGIYTKLIHEYNTLIVKDYVMVVKKDCFNLVNGFNEKINKYNHVDFCLKLYHQGFYHVIKPDVQFILDQPINHPDEHIKFADSYDPFYNFNLDSKQAYYLKNTGDHKKHVFVIGSRGYEFHYGGWETFVKELIDHSHNPDIIFHVSGLGGVEKHYKLNDHLYIDLFPLNKFGKMQMYMHTKKATKYYKKYVCNNKLKNSIFYILGLKLGNYLTFNHHRLNKLGIKILVNPDGLEWKRGKYGLIGKTYFLITEKLMLNHCDNIICDAKGIYKYIKNKYPRNKIPKEIITYGVKEYHDFISEKELNDQYHLTKDGYLLVVGRLVPENNLDYIIKEFVSSDINKQLVIVTNESKPVFKQWCQSHHIKLNKKVVYLGPVYEEKNIYSLRHYAWAYIHGHSVGGTNPSLLESFYLTPLVIAYDICFNKDICHNGALYFCLEENSLCDLLNNYQEIDAQRSSYHDIATRLINKNHTWDIIALKYDKIFKKED